MDPVERFLYRDGVGYEEVEIEIPAEEWNDGADDGDDPRRSAACVVVDDGEVLLVRNQWSEGWIAPGGSVEAGETFEAAAVREVEEEAGVVVEIERPARVERQVFRHAGDPGRSTVGYFVLFEARATDREVRVDGGVEGEEIRDAAWFDEMPAETPVEDVLRDYL